MPRQPRRKSETGIYHIIIRGVNKQTIFEDDEDRQKFIDAIIRFKEVSNYQVYGYCLMDNHVHLLIEEKDEPVSIAIKRISSSYVIWYNNKYLRCGHLFQDRFKSEAVESERYLLTVLRYIHQNPVKAGIRFDAANYKWSSYNEYIGKNAVINTDYILKIFSENKNRAIELFKSYTKEKNDDDCLDYEEGLRVSDDEVKRYLQELNLMNSNELQQLQKEERNKIIKILKTHKGLSIRQISRVTGVSKSIVERI